MKDRDKLTSLLRSGDWDSAEKLLRRAAKSPDAPAAVAYNLAKVLLEKNNQRQAIHWFRTALSKNPRHAAAWFELGRCFIEAADLVQARACFANVVDIDPTDQDAWRNLGRVALRLGEWETAERAWSRFADDDSEAACGLFRANAELGKANLSDAQALVTRFPGPESLAAITRPGRGVLPLRLLG